MSLEEDEQEARDRYERQRSNARKTVPFWSLNKVIAQIDEEEAAYISALRSLSGEDEEENPNTKSGFQKKHARELKGRDEEYYKYNREKRKGQEPANKGKKSPNKGKPSFNRGNERQEDGTFTHDWSEVARVKEEREALKKLEDGDGLTTNDDWQDPDDNWGIEKW